MDMAVESGDGSSISILEGTLKVLRRFCTEGFYAPFMAKRRTHCKLDKRLHAHVKRTIECVDTDAAPDEKRAVKMMKSGHASIADEPAVPPQFVNLKLHNLDKMHASRRTSAFSVLRRAFQCIARHFA